MNKFAIALVVLLLLAAVAPVATAAALPSNRHIFISVGNDAGVKYNLDGTLYGGPDNTYYIKADGGGLNELHITADTAVSAGQVTATTTSSTNPSGVIYVSNTGGRGFDDDIILLVAVNGTLADDFSVAIRTSGYNWTPVAVANQVPTGYIHEVGVVDETFTKADFIYGPQTWKPGPGTIDTPPYLPLYFNQDQNDGQTYQLLFVDLRVGNMLPSKFPEGTGLTDVGDAKVEFQFHNLTSQATFNAYGWCLAANQGQGISWTNRMDNPGASGYSILHLPPAPTPIIIQGQTNVPTDPDGDGINEDMNGNGIKDFNDLVIFFNKMEWIQANEPVSLFDFNHNGIIDFNDIVRLFQEL